MDFIQLLSFTLIASLLVISPGPNGLLIAKTVPTHGQKAGFSNVLGFLAAFYLHGALSILGISVLLSKSAEIFFIVKVVGALYLAWIGVKSLISAYRNVDIVDVKTDTINVKTLRKSFVEGFLTNALNPKVSMLYLAAFPQFIQVGEHAILYCYHFSSLFLPMQKILSHLLQMAVVHFQTAHLNKMNYGYLVAQHMIMLIGKEVPMMKG